MLVIRDGIFILVVFEVFFYLVCFVLLFYDYLWNDSYVLVNVVLWFCRILIFVGIDNIFFFEIMIVGLLWDNWLFVVEVFLLGWWFEDFLFKG